jgi:hypothetical protein
MPSAIASANAAARAASQQASPGFKPNTPDEVLSQMAQDGLQAAPDGKLSGTPGWLRYLANGRPDVDMPTALQAIQAAEQAGHVLPGTADALATHPGGYDAAQLQAIQQHLPPLPGGSAKGHRAAGGAPPVDSTGAPIRNPYAYQGAIKAYQSNVESAAQQAAGIGLPDVANALRDIGINHHHASHKEAARAALPEHIRQHIPDWLVKHGGKG